MSKESEDTATITLPVESWRQVQAVLVVEARELVEAERFELAETILDDLFAEIAEEVPDILTLGLACQIEEQMSDGPPGAVVGSIG